eukprot:CAMPEP_0174304344 /NCGR_PEP_ID=MMETSP0809-20121228/60732_1 /TAXON_ID=73025 ORGANISM="Eutreptiella gymnastica-like, Strain CCMP1594" /NCGR_SAMPLE_ID=MMETSP0809 /ASSEMBLY_ACC=CAM_ASM_000658 /LENGTH=67 /DNA_ID=CAMNT_0015410553 /DNA_START=1422 /DNA_END=1622 /DNA_ORIENTATION=-
MSPKIIPLCCLHCDFLMLLVVDEPIQQQSNDDNIQNNDGQHLLSISNGFRPAICPGALCGRFIINCT